MDPDNTLVLTHVVFRHGDRTPDLSYPNDPHKDVTFFPIGRGHLTNKGKKTTYELGKTLRKRYDRFLGSLYTPNIVDPWTTESDRTKMSVQLVLAALFPPTDEQRFEATLNWQPIPYKFVTYTKDDMLLPLILPEVRDAYQAYLLSPKGDEARRKHEETFEYLTKHTGMPVNSAKEALFLYVILKVQKEVGLDLPPWTATLFPNTLESLAIEQYYALTGTPKLRKLILGKLISKIIEDTRLKIEGKSVCKMHLYSGHDINIAVLMCYFDIPFVSFPKYCSYVSFEVHKIDDVYGIKILYGDYSNQGPIVTKFRNGSDFVDFDEFKRICEDAYQQN